ncbi:DUF983 domain-containing protein [Flavihumibacter sp. R14]|nr:DUF983 domain-containing protein [Flavihumibacter soli]
MELKPQQKEPSALSAALHAKCPRCRKGDLFANSMYGFKTQVMNENCGYCGLRFEREPGYFYVAMFVSYGMTVLQMIAIGVLTYLITGEESSPWIYITTIFVGIVLLSPINYRYSRVILLYWLTPGLNYSPGRRDQSGRQDLK